MPIQVDHEVRRQLVAEIVAGIIASKGLEAVTVRAVAEASGFSTRVVSHYFSGKREVLLLCYRQTAQRSRTRLEHAAAASPGDITAALDALLPCHEQAREDWLVWVSFWGMAIGDLEFSAIQRTQFRMARELFAALLADSLGGPHEAERVARHLLVSLSGMAVEAAFDPDSWPAERQRLHLREAIGAAVGTWR
jgi:TetR/AcrR family transcriptional repressor of bet genes